MQPMPKVPLPALTERDMHDVKIKISKSRADLVWHHPFYGAIALRLNMVADESVGTFCVDGYTIKYAPSFANTLTTPEIVGVIAHEVMHVVLLHHTRRGNRHPIIWNWACDYAINLILTKSGFTLPKGGLLDAKYHGMGAEEIYTLLIQDLPQLPPDERGESNEGNESDSDNVGNCPSDSGNDDGAGDMLPINSDGTKPKTFDKVTDKPADKTTEEAEQAAKEQTQTGMIAAKQQGKMPGNLEGIIDVAHEPQVHWRDRLRELLQHRSRGDQAWHRPNKRLRSVAYLPYFEEEPTGNLVLAIDTSGSVSDTELSMYGAEIQDIMLDNKIEKITVIYCDTKINKIEEFEMGEDLDFQIHAVGRGGTYFEPPFEYVQEHDLDPSAFIYFTDGEAGWPDESLLPSCPIIWCITNSQHDIEPPYGDVIKLSFKDRRYE